MTSEPTMTSTPKSSAAPKAASVPALDKAFEILDFLTQSPTPVSAAAIAKELGLARSTTHNILQALSAKGVLYKDANHLFSLGSYLLYWAGRFEMAHGVAGVFHELVASFDELTPYTVTLSTIDFERGETVFLSSHQGTSAIDFVFRRGIRVPALFSATGKAILSQQPFKQVVSMYPDFPAPLTERGVADFDQLKGEFEHIKQTRLSLDDGQLRLGMTCIGTYIQSPDDKVKLGIAVSLSDSEYDNKKAEIGDALIKLAQAIESRMGISQI
ncbi:Transcriptional regulator, IclR family [Moraxella catarrhalis]|uniref:HTH-type transcriptional repressor AllR n=2 Tax=Moraxella catarrhalis TaxID=480 RepID=A0A198UHV5_MORCA|nr:Transcriptional regulator, IclR family [Moraxella catarrhalis]